MATERGAPRGPVAPAPSLSGVVGIAPNTSSYSALYDDGTQLHVIAWIVNDQGQVFGCVLSSDGVPAIARELPGFVKYTTTAPVPDISQPLVPGPANMAPLEAEPPAELTPPAVDTPPVEEPMP